MPEPMPTPPEPSAPTCPKCGHNAPEKWCTSLAYTAFHNDGTGKGVGLQVQSEACLGRERDALAAQVAALRADVARLEGEHSTLKNKYDWLFQQNCELNHRVEVEDADVIQRLESALASARADAVPGSVAMDAICYGLDVGFKVGRSPEKVMGHEIPTAERSFPSAATACLDRALAEHAAAQQGDRARWEAAGERAVQRDIEAQHYAQADKEDRDAEH